MDGNFGKNDSGFDGAGGGGGTDEKIAKYLKKIREEEKKYKTKNLPNEPVGLGQDEEDFDEDASTMVRPMPNEQQQKEIKKRVIRPISPQAKPGNTPNVGNFGQRKDASVRTWETLGELLVLGISLILTTIGVLSFQNATSFHGSLLAAATVMFLWLEVLMVVDYGIFWAVIGLLPVIPLAFWWLDSRRSIMKRLFFSLILLAPLSILMIDFIGLTPVAKSTIHADLAEKIGKKNRERQNEFEPVRGRYSNPLIGISLEFPGGWYRKLKDETDPMITGRMIQFLSGDFKHPKNKLRISVEMASQNFVKNFPNVEEYEKIHTKMAQLFEETNGEKYEKVGFNPVNIGESQGVRFLGRISPNSNYHVKYIVAQGLKLYGFEFFIKRDNFDTEKNSVDTIIKSVKFILDRDFNEYISKMTKEELRVDENYYFNRIFAAMGGQTDNDRSKAWQQKYLEDFLATTANVPGLNYSNLDFGYELKLTSLDWEIRKITTQIPALPPADIELIEKTKHGYCRISPEKGLYADSKQIRDQEVAKLKRSFSDFMIISDAEINQNSIPGRKVFAKGIKSSALGNFKIFFNSLYLSEKNGNSYTISCLSTDKDYGRLEQDFNNIIDNFQAYRDRQPEKAGLTNSEPAAEPSSPKIVAEPEPKSYQRPAPSFQESRPVEPRPTRSLVKRNPEPLPNRAPSDALFPGTTPEPQQKRHIVVYTSANCFTCPKVLQFLKQKNIDYVEKNNKDNPQFQDELMNVTKSKRIIYPTILDGDQVVCRGLDMFKLKKYFE
jgi:glutaredoxin